MVVSLIFLYALIVVSLTFSYNDDPFEILQAGEKNDLGRTGKEAWISRLYILKYLEININWRCIIVHKEKQECSKKLKAILKSLLLGSHTLRTSVVSIGQF